MSLNKPQGSSIPVYAALSQIREEPSQDQLNNGVVPLDTLPAAWWNWLWNTLTKAQNDSLYNNEILFQEINSVITGAGLNAGTAPNHDQLWQAINLIKRTIATAAEPGSVVSTDSGTHGTIRVAADGKMTVNNFGDLANFHGASKGSLTDALNEVYDMAYTSDDELGDVTGLDTTDKDSIVGAINEVKANADSRAIKMHKSLTDEYGAADRDNYGHVMLADAISGSDASMGVAATPKMVQGVVLDTINTLNAPRYDYVVYDQASFEEILCRNMIDKPLVSAYNNMPVTVLIRDGTYVIDKSYKSGDIVWDGVLITGEESASARIKCCIDGSYMFGRAAKCCVILHNLHISLCNTPVLSAAYVAPEESATLNSTYENLQLNRTRIFFLVVGDEFTEDAASSYNGRNYCVLDGIAPDEVTINSPITTASPYRRAYESSVSIVSSRIYVVANNKAAINTISGLVPTRARACPCIDNLFVLTNMNTAPYGSDAYVRTDIQGEQIYNCRDSYFRTVERADDLINVYADLGVTKVSRTWMGGANRGDTARPLENVLIAYVPALGVCRYTGYSNGSDTIQAMLGRGGFKEYWKDNALLEPTGFFYDRDCTQPIPETITIDQFAATSTNCVLYMTVQEVQP